VMGAPWWRVSGGKEPPVAGRRSGGGRRFKGRGAAVSSGGGHCRSHVHRPRGTARAASPCGGAQWIGD
jgi:hypothetical protein